MNNIFPIELSNIIYVKRATLHLVKLVEEYYINYDKLCEYLIVHNAVIAGSAAISCFDLLCEVNDIDIFVKCSEDDPHTQCYKDFLNVFDIEPSLITVDKSPICNSLSDIRNPHYHYKFVYDTPRNFSIGFGRVHKLNIDMILIHNDVRSKLSEYKEFNVSTISFDGRSWNTNLRNIEEFIFDRQIKIMNPYDNYFAEVYDFSGETLETVVACIYKFYLIYRPGDVHRILFDKYIEYYKFPPDDYLQSIRNMCKLYHDIKGTQITDEYLLNGGDNRKDYIDILKKLFSLYRGTYRILKYITKGYTITNINDFLS